MKTKFENIKNRWKRKQLDKVEKLCKKLNIPYDRTQPENHQISILWNTDEKAVKFIITECPTLAGAGLFDFRCPPTGVQCYLNINDINKIILESVH